MLENPTACNGCGGALRTRLESVLDPWTRERFSIADCETCGLGHTVPRPADIERYYASYHTPRSPLTRALCARRRVRRVAAVARGGKLLDVGCGDGSFLAAAREKGWEVAGTELNPKLAREKGLTVRGSLDEARELGPFDCVTLWGSLEHLTDPRGTLVATAGMLAPGGVVLITVPDAEGAQARLFGPHWYHLDVPRHLHHFGERSLARMLDGAGLSVVRRWRREIEYDVLGWSQSLMNKISREPNAFFYGMTGRGGRKVVPLLFGLGASALAVPPSMFDAGSALFTVAARKNS